MLTDEEKRKEKFYAAIFLSSIAGMSAIFGFGSTLAAARKQDPNFFTKGLSASKSLPESGASLAFRALLWGSFYAWSGCGMLFYGVWKLSGAETMEQFRNKIGNLLPRIPKNDPPQSRTEFEGLTDLLRYVSEEWGKEKQ